MKSTDAQEAQEDLKELRNLIQQAEKLIDALAMMLPPDRVNWLAWRHQGIRKRLGFVQTDLHRLTEQMQVMMLHEAAKVVETKVEVKRHKR